MPSFVSRARRIVTMAMLLAVATTLGCIRARDISMRAVDYNVAAENARSEMLLLNVLRARDRKPLIFTGLTRISGSVRSAVGLGASVPTGPDAEGRQFFSPSASLSDAPSFDVAVLDSQEFTRGIMTPLTFELIEYLWDQGFSLEMLFLLVVERVDVECAAGEQTLSLVNDPTEPSFTAFRAFIDVLVGAGEWEIDDHRVESVGPPLSTADVKSLGALIQVANGDLQVRELEGGDWQLERPSSGLRLAVDGVNPCKNPTPTRYRLYESKSALRRAAEVAPDETKGRIVLRSPQSVLYYLGELTRPGRAVSLRDDPEGSKPASERRLFAIEPAGRCGKAHVRVGYDGAQQVIPRGTGDCHPGRSMQSLALAAQLLALQQSSSDLPAAGTVRLIGQ